MVSSMISSATMATVAPVQSGAAATTSFPSAFKPIDMSTSSAKLAVKTNCFRVWPPEGLKKFETLSYLPPLTLDQLAKEVEYLIRSGWVPCLEFSVEGGFVYRENHRSPGYYDGRYWTMWKLPMFGCTDSSQVVKELEECKAAYPHAFIRIIGFDNKRQVQCISFIAYKPEGF